MATTTTTMTASPENFDGTSFFGKVRRLAGKLPFIMDALAMYYCMLDARTPTWVKASVAGALVYFVSPVDAIPDALIGIGYTDDAAVVLATAKAIESSLKPRHYGQAKRAMA